MKVHHVRVAVFLFFVLYAAAVTWPGTLPFNRARPFILGLPFSMAWAVLWIILGGLALWTLDRSESRARERVLREPERVPGRSADGPRIAGENAVPPDGEVGVEPREGPSAGRTGRHTDARGESPDPPEGGGR